jgi:hypothetical protein
MSNLSKYIYRINEQNSNVNAGGNPEKDAEKYEKLIAYALNFLISQEEIINELQNIDEKEKNSKDNILNQKEETEDEVKIELRKIKDELEVIKANTKDKNKKTKINSIKQKIENTNQDLNIKDKDRINTVIKKINNFLENKDKLKKLAEKLKMQQNNIEFAKCIDKNFGEPKEDYMKALFLANKIKKILENKSSNSDLISVEHMGSQKGTISEHWSNISNKVSKIKGSTSTGKTDIRVKTGNIDFKLSLKMANNQLASPTYNDIYTLIMHGITMFIDNKSSKIINSMPDDFKNKIKIEKEIKTTDEEKKKILAKLKEEIKLTDEKTQEYATAINLSLLLELFIQEVFYDNNNPKKPLTDQTLADALFACNANNKNLKNIIKRFKQMFYNVNSLEEGIKEKEKEIFNSLFAEEGINVDFEKVEEIKKKKEELQKIINAKRESIFKTGFILNKHYPDTDSAIKHFIVEIKKSSFFNINVSGELNNLTLDEHIEKIYDLFNDTKIIKNSKDITKIIYIDKMKQYELVFKIKDIQKNANMQFEKLFDQANIEKILKEKFNNDKILKLLTSRDSINFIKNEMLKEAITGKYKFNDEKYQANYILEFAIPKIEDIEKSKILENTDANKSKKFIKLYDISTDTYLNLFVNSLDKQKFNFSFKASGGKSYMSMRVSAFFKEKLEKNENEEVITLPLGFLIEEGFLSDTVNTFKDTLADAFDIFKNKALKVIFVLKNKASKFLKLFDIKVKVDKSSKMPAWIVNKL